MAREVPPEIVIYGDDYGDDVVPGDSGGQSDDQGARRSAKAPSGGPGRWALPVVGAVLVFGFGAAVGSHGTGPQVAGTPLPATTLAATTRAVPPSTTAAGDPSSTVLDPGTWSGQQTPTDTVPETTESGVAAAPWTLVKDRCGQSMPISVVTGAQPLPGGADLNLIAGAEARVVSPGSGPDLMPLLDEIADASKEYVSGIDGRDGRYVAAVASCEDRAAVRFVEITAGAGSFSTSPIKATVPAGVQAGGLLMGGETPWTELFRTTQASDGANSTTEAGLLALDGSGRTVSLPSAFWPVGAYQHFVVGILQPLTRMPAQSPVGSIVQVFDITKGTIVRQLDSYVARYVMGDGYLLWEPQCPGPCEIHRYDIATGKGEEVGPAPNLDNEALVNWVAVSPDGKRIAMFVPRGDPVPLGDGGYQIDGSPGYSLVVLDVATGITSEARGIDQPLGFASVEFSPDSQWLVVTLTTSRGGAVVAYDSRMRGPYQVASLPDVVDGFVPFVVLPT